MYLKRLIDNDLELWVNEPERKPLLLRGARQVGKSTVVKELGKRFRYFLEINFEEHKSVHSLFAGDLSPNDLCGNLSVYFGIPVIPGETLLFFDEIQSCLPAISSLRFFYEKLPALHVIAAGSLLEFALEELPSYGVGRVRSMFLYPFSFNEFLMASGETALLSAKAETSHNRPFPEAFHRKLIQYLKQFLILGGMPEVISRYIGGSDLLASQMVLDDLTIALKSDFAKYRKRVPSSRISEVFNSVVQQMGGKFTFSKASTDANQKQIKEALELLIMAGLVIPVTHTSANGVPLGAGANIKMRKMLILDTGIFQRLLGLNISELLFEDNFQAVNKGSIAEMHVGLEILKYTSRYNQQNLYYWQREMLNSQAEVDYIVQKQLEIVPVEVKSGSKGSMQSLFLFLKEKNLPYGVRISLENFNSYDKIRVYPLYAVSEFLSNDLRSGS